MKEALNLSGGIFIGWLWSYVKSLLNDLWDEVWEQYIKTAVITAEIYWNKQEGELKKEWLMKNINCFLDKKLKLTWLQRKIINIFFSRVVDSLVAKINADFGKDWGKRVDEVKVYLEKLLPIID